MSSLPPLVSLPERVSFSSAPAKPRRLVKPLPRAKNLEAERARRAASMRGRKRNRQTRLVTLALLSPLAVLTLWWGVRAVANQSPWPAGNAWMMGLPCEQAPVAVGQNWFFASNTGDVWHLGRGQSQPQKVWSGAFPASARLVASSGAMFVAGRDGTVLRLNAKGNQQWRFKNSGAISSRPALFQNGDASTLVGGDDTGRLWARDAKSGKALWQRSVGAPIGDGATSTPWGVVIPLLGSGTTRGGLRCVSPSDGTLKWSFPANPRIRAAGTALARFDARTNRLFWCNDGGAVFALDARTGRKLWKSFAVPHSGSKDAVMLRASPVLANGALIVGGSDGGLRAFDAATGRALWTRWIGQPLASPLGKIRFENRVVVTAGTSPISLVDAEKGTLIRSLGGGQVAWNGAQFAAADESGVWRRWTGD